MSEYMDGWMDGWMTDNNSEILKFLKFIYFWLHWVFVPAHWLSLVAASRGYSSLWCAGFSLQWLLLLRSTGSRAHRLQ